jgi:hypothetical protein
MIRSYDDYSADEKNKVLDWHATQVALDIGEQFADIVFAVTGESSVDSLKERFDFTDDLADDFRRFATREQVFDDMRRMMEIAVKVGIEIDIKFTPDPDLVRCEQIYNEAKNDQTNILRNPQKRIDRGVTAGTG